MSAALKPTCIRTFPSGALDIFVTYKREFYKKTYFGYTKREALRRFKAEVKEKTKNRN